MPVFKGKMIIMGKWMPMRLKIIKALRKLKTATLMRMDK